MQFIVAACVLFYVCAINARPEGDEKYTTKYDNIDLDDILKNERLLLRYVNCMMEKQKCTADGAELKKMLPEAMANGCKNCSEKQKQGSKKVITYLMKNKPAIWQEIKAKYDPENNFAQFADKLKITVLK